MSSLVYALPAGEDHNPDQMIPLRRTLRPHEPVPSVGDIIDLYPGGNPYSNGYVVVRRRFSYENDGEVKILVGLNHR